MFKKS